MSAYSVHRTAEGRSSARSRQSVDASTSVVARMYMRASSEATNSAGATAPITADQTPPVSPAMRRPSAASRGIAAVPSNTGKRRSTAGLLDTTANSRSMR